jgi:hypothetical protein
VGLKGFSLRNYILKKKKMSLNNVLELKSIHFKETVAQSSFFFKSVVIFPDFVLISAKKTTLLKEMRIVQLSS